MSSGTFNPACRIAPSAPIAVRSFELMTAVEHNLPVIWVIFDDAEFNPEVRCIAVPVMDFTGQTVGALGISGPIWRLSIQALQNHAKTIRAAANRLSAEFGAKDTAKDTAKTS